MKRVAHRMSLATSALILLTILVVVNLLAAGFFRRVDLTEGKFHTLSPFTVKTLQNLDDIVTVKAYFSRELPPTMIPVRERVQEILEEYRALSKGKLRFAFVDPGEDEKEKRKVLALGIPEVRLDIISKDKFEAAPAFLGLGLFYEDKKEVIPVVRSTQTLEYDLTAAIKKLTGGEVKTIGFLTKGDIRSDYATAVRALEKLYKVRKVDLKEGKSVPVEVSTLVVLGPGEKADEEVKYAIDQFLMRGGRVFFLIDTIKVDDKMRATPETTGLEDLLRHYGASVGRDLVTDPASPMLASFRSALFTITRPYPYWIKVVRQGMDRENPITAELSFFVLPWTSSIEIVKGKQDSIRADELARTSPFAYTQTGFINLNPNQEFKPPEEGAGQKLLVLLLQGRFKSFFEGKDIPGKEEKKEETITESPETAVLVVGTSRFLQEQFVNQFRPSLFFFLNAVDAVTLDADLISVRSRWVRSRPLNEGKEIPEKTKRLIKYVNIGGVPLLLVLFGTSRFLIRRHARRRFARKYESGGKNG